MRDVRLITLRCAYSSAFAAYTLARARQNVARIGHIKDDGRRTMDDELSTEGVELVRLDDELGTPADLPSTPADLRVVQVNTHQALTLLAPHNPHTIFTARSHQRAMLELIPGHMWWRGMGRLRLPKFF